MKENLETTFCSIHNGPIMCDGECNKCDDNIYQEELDKHVRGQSNILNVAAIAGSSITDGPGIRVAIFGQGCPHCCPGCHNPETWDHNTERKMMTVNELYDIVRSNPLCKGVTFSGGEPFSQTAGFAELAERLKVDGYEVACYTGYTYESLVNKDYETMKLLKNIDILVDGRYVQEKRNLNLYFRGSENQRIIDVKESLKQESVVISSDPRWIGEDA